jgi:5'-nucleotidase
MRKRIVLVSLAVVSLAAVTPDARRQGPAGAVSPVSPAGAVTVQLLAINDFHGYLEPPSGTAGVIGDAPAGGAEYMATHLKNAVAENRNSIVVAAGDLIGASPLISALFHDEPAIESLNAMNLAVSSVGNHEFDKGSVELLRLQGLARFRYLSANVIRAGTAPEETLFPATDVRTVGGVKIGFVGETLAGTPQIVSPAGVQALGFLDEARAANASAALLKNQGVNAIVLLIHQGGEQTDGADPNGCSGFHGDILPIVDRLSADIKVVISGHTHQFYNCTLGGRSVTSASSFGRMITRVNVTIDPRSDSIVGVAARNEVVTRDVAKDTVQTSLIAKYGERARPVANRVVGSVTGDLARAANPAGESRLGDVIADAQLAATSAPAKGGAVVAFMNSGGIRTDLVASHLAGAGRPGEVTYGDLFAVQPFGNAITVLTMTGDAVRRLLEQQFENPAAGHVLQVSHGFTYRYKLSAPAGRHVDPASIAIDGRVIAPAASVRVAASDFLVAGGDGFTVFSEGRDRLGGDLDIDALAEYFRAHSPVRPGPQDRIVRQD